MCAMGHTWRSEGRFQELVLLPCGSWGSSFDHQVWRRVPLPIYITSSSHQFFHLFFCLSMCAQICAHVCGCMQTCVHICVEARGQLQMSFFRTQSTLVFKMVSHTYMVFTISTRLATDPQGSSCLCHSSPGITSTC